VSGVQVERCFNFARPVSPVCSALGLLRSPTHLVRDAACSGKTSRRSNSRSVTPVQRRHRQAAMSRPAAAFAELRQAAFATSIWCPAQRVAALNHAFHHGRQSGISRRMGRFPWRVDVSADDQKLRPVGKRLPQLKTKGGIQPLGALHDPAVDHLRLRIRATAPIHRMALCVRDSHNHQTVFLLTEDNAKRKPHHRTLAMKIVEPQKSIRVDRNPFNDLVYRCCKCDCRTLRSLGIPIE